MCYNISALHISVLMSCNSVTYRGESAAVTAGFQHKRTHCPVVNLNIISGTAGMFNTSLHVLSDPAWETPGN